MTQPEKANVNSILGTALFGIVSDLTKAKEDGKQLPGLLDKIASVALDAKEAGMNFAKEEAKVQAKKAIPWIGLSVAVGIIVYLLARQK